MVKTVRERAVYPKRTVLDVRMGVIAMPESVVVGVEIITARMPEHEGVGPWIAVDHPEDRTDVTDRVETVVVSVDSVVGHDRKIIVGLGRYVGASVPCRIVPACRTVCPSRSRRRGVVGIEPKNRIEGR